MLHTVYSIHCILSTHCNTLHTVYSTHCLFYTLYTLHTVYSTPCILYTLYTLHSVYSTLCVSHTLRNIHRHEFLLHSVYAADINECQAQTMVDVVIPVSTLLVLSIVNVQTISILLITTEIVYVCIYIYSYRQVCLLMIAFVRIRLN